MFFWVQWDMVMLPYCRVVTKFSRQNSMTFPWFFHDCFTKFHDVLIAINVNLNLKSCRLAALIHENQEFVCQIPWLFHDFLFLFQNSMTFKWPVQILVRIPWIFQKSQKVVKIPEIQLFFHDHGNPDIGSLTKCLQWSTNRVPKHISPPYYFG